MYLVKMRPEQLQDAVARNVPLLMPAGVVEYHGPHLPIGTDFLIANAICEQVEQRCEVVIAPPLPFGPTMSWAAGPQDGEMDFAPEPFFGYVREMFQRLALFGFRRMYVLQHHQGPERLQCLCLRRAAGELLRDTVHDWGAGFGRKDPATWPIPRLFQWVQVAFLDSFSAYPSPTAERVPVGHAGKGETQLIMGSYPETVRLEALETLTELPEWLEDATLASPDEGRRWIDFCVQGWVRELTRHG